MLHKKYLKYKSKYLASLHGGESIIKVTLKKVSFTSYNYDLDNNKTIKDIKIMIMDLENCELSNIIIIKDSDILYNDQILKDLTDGENIELTYILENIEIQKTKGILTSSKLYEQENLNYIKKIIEEHNSVFINILQELEPKTVASTYTIIKNNIEIDDASHILLIKYLLKIDKIKIANIPEKYRKKEIIKLAVQNDKTALSYLTEKCRADKEIVSLAVKNHGWSLYYASEELKSDKEIVSLAVKNYGKALKDASEELKNDKDIVKLAVKNDGEAFNYASEELRSDKEFVSLLVNINGIALEFASEDIKNDRDIVKLAVQNNGMALIRVNNKYKDDKEIVSLAVQNADIFLHLYEKYNDDKEIVRLVVQKYGYQLSLASTRLKNDPEIVKLAIQNDGKALKYASRKLQNDPEIVRLAKAQK